MSSTSTDDENPLKLRLYQIDRTVVFTLNPGEINEQKIQYHYTCDAACYNVVNLIDIHLFICKYHNLSGISSTFMTKSERFQEIDPKKYGDKKLDAYHIYNFLVLSVELIK